MRRRWSWFRSAAVILNVGYGLVGAVAILFEHEGPVRVGIAWVLGLIGAVFLRATWRSLRGEQPLVARFLAAGVTAVGGVVPLVFAAQLVVGAWGGNGVITDAKLAGVFVGETKTAVHESLGNPLQHLAAAPDLAQWLGDTRGADCDVYEKNPGLQGGLYAHVCYVDGKVSEIVPFK
jgi:hypothetical protein